MPGGQGFRRLTRERCHGESQVGVHVQPARLVVGVELLVAVGEVVAVHQAPLTHEAAPKVIAVTANQGVVQVENRQCHDRGLGEKGRKHSRWPAVSKFLRGRKVWNNMRPK